MQTMSVLKFWALFLRYNLEIKNRKKILRIDRQLRFRKYLKKLSPNLSQAHIQPFKVYFLIWFLSLDFLWWLERLMREFLWKLFMRNTKHFHHQTIFFWLLDMSQRKLIDKATIYLHSLAIFPSTKSNSKSPN